jgi:predicted dienelactone hydrolase
LPPITTTRDVIASSATRPPRSEQPSSTPKNRSASPGAWTQATELARRNELCAFLNFALTHPTFCDAIDTSRIGAVGHSLGAYTAIGLAGGWNNWRDPRIQFALALSPYVVPFLLAARLADVRVPVMYQIGTRDIGIRSVLLTKGGYAQTGGRKHLVVSEGAGHFAWTELNPQFQTVIALYAISFFDRELLEKPAPLLDQVGGKQIFEYRHST